MHKRFQLLFLFILFMVNVNAQKTLVGFLRDSITDFAIANGTVTNATTNTSAKTDKGGLFRLQVSPNDFIYATAKSYHYDTLAYSFIFTDTITIHLSPAGNILPTVKVTTLYNKYQLDSMERKEDFEQSRGTTLRTLAHNHPSGFGLTFNLDPIFKSKYKNRKKEDQIFANIEKMAYVNYRFSAYIVGHYTRLKGDALSKFLNLYTPDYNWLRQNSTNEDVMLYINDKLKDYRHLIH